MLCPESCLAATLFIITGYFDDVNRRKVLLSSGVALTTALAGCGESESNRETGDPDGNGNENGNEDDTGTDNSDTGSTEDGSNEEEQLVELLNHEWYNDGQYSSGVTGQVENVSGETLDYVEVAVYFMDEDGVQFEESYANTSELAADRVWEFDAMFLGDDPQRVDEYEVETSVDNY